MKNHVLVIAEAGVNHNGDLALAKKMVAAAAEAGADIVKFQTFKAENLASPVAALAQYQAQNISDHNQAQIPVSQLEMLKSLELKHEYHFQLIDECKKHNIRFLSTGFDLESIQFLSTLNMGIWKVPSGEITNLPYLEKIGQSKLPVIVSTGMADMNEIKESIEVLVKNGSKREEITVLQCNTEYPTPFQDVNLRAMATISKELGLKVGYSDHTIGIEASVAAVALGATVIEKHFTLDRNLAGPDHKASLLPSELKSMISAIRNIELALGHGVKKPTQSELPNRNIARKSIAARVAIKAGENLTADNLTTLRPGSGISPMKWHQVIGTKAAREYQPGELL